MKKLFLISFMIPVFSLSFGQVSGFQDELKIKGSHGNGFFGLVGSSFDQTGRMFAYETNGKLWAVRYDSSNVEQRYLMLDISNEVLSTGDLGLVSMVLDPDFLVNGYIYLMYSVNRQFLLTGNDGGDDVSQAGTIVRVTRYTADINTDFTTLIADSRFILIGDVPSDGIPVLGPNHGGGCLVFGNDGTLLISTGDGSVVGNDTGNNGYVFEAIDAGIITPAQNVGSYRCQMDSSLNGKVLRINPMTGEGYASNPHYEPNKPRAAQSRMWAKGFRNPYRMTLMPNTGGHHSEEGNPGVLIVGDVGGYQREEINTVTASDQNFGWPHYEGIDSSNEAFDDSTYIPAINRKPVFEYREHAFHANVFLNQATKKQLGTHEGEFFYNGLDVFKGSTIVIGNFYQGSRFPAKYHNALFFADFGAKWIRAMTFDANYDPATIEDFVQIPDQIVGVTFNPKEDAIYYISGNTAPCDEAHKITYSSADTPPIAKIEVDVNNGIAPLPVAFSAIKSYDPDATELTYEWRIDDVVFSTGLAPHYLFKPSGDTSQTYKIKLKVTDQNGTGTSAVDSVYIYANNTRPIVLSTSLDTVTSIPPNQNYNVNLSAIVTDAQTSANNLILSWTIAFAHNGHEHKDSPLIGNNISATLPAVGCEVGEATYWYKIYLKVTDIQGLSETVVKNIEVNCAGMAQTITFDAIPNQEININALNSLSASAVSSVGVTPLYYFTMTGPAYTIDNQIKLTGKPGKVAIRAVQHGNVNYKPALPIDRFFDVDRTTTHYVMRFDSIPDKLTTDTSFTIIATTTPTEEISTYMLISGPATLSGNTVSLTGDTGTVRIRAYFEGNYFKRGVYMDRVFKVNITTLQLPQDEIIYGDALNPNWQNFSSISSLDIANTSPPFINTKSIKITNPISDETLDFRKNAALHVADFPHGIEFWVYNEGNTPFPLQVQTFETNNGGGGNIITVMADPKKWVHYVLEWNLFGSPTQIGKVIIKLNQSQAESLYFDEIKLLYCADMQSVKTGNWNDASVWSCGRIPIVTDTVTINTEHTVTIANGQSATLNLLYLLGTLNKEVGSVLNINNY
ncbi:PQQ-dependent sugar dehydrogenase [Arcicella sp. LKC2W]|uniref:PQQ-dependent sugar dehydrogenase n=1 Tax=Arcicella sp. LKC2W TaxID=2984198 RepID=UPI002B21B118|nr:PQQ-dependent sugar dehydrogenase [Arcicella sp. LKC2W]MEA5460249.1 PQQ-dependent sugar dehydrogenase [Arcicella sp. LKC2W]